MPVACALAFAPAFGQQLPTGGSVAAGAAVISQTGAGSLRIDQSSRNAILNWQSFSIGAGNSVVFQQPGASAVALNRVVGSSSSEIFGSLSANGQIFLVNPNGVLFGRSAQVDVGGLAASTLGIRDSDFLAGRYVFSNGGGAGTVSNAGTITTLSGYTALIGPQVSNSGVINARMGTAAMAAGDKVALDMVGDGLISVRVDQAAMNASAINSGTILADGGNVLMTARSANALLDTVLNNEGIIRANTLAARGGSIYLDGGNTGITSNAGTLEATGLGAGLRGGNVTVLGDKVGLFGNAKIDASGDAGGGTVLIGGNWQGKGPEPNASMTVVGNNATIRADAVTKGDGGKVVVWSNDATVFAGSLQAKGGSAGGSGGTVEVSGKRSLDFSPKHIDLRSSNGTAGTLLLDPEDIIVADGGTAAYSDVNAFSAQAGTTKTVSPATLDAVGGTVSLQANHDITINSDVRLNTPGAGLEARAGNDINVNALINTKGGAVTLSARDPSGAQTAGGTVRIGSWIESSGYSPGPEMVFTNNGGANPIEFAGTVISWPGSVTFSDKVKLSGFSSVNTGTLKFQDTIDGPSSLIAQAFESALFAADIGSNVPLSTFMMSLPGVGSFKNVTTIGDQAYGNSSILNGTYKASSGQFFAPSNATLAGPTTISAGSAAVKVWAVDGAYPFVVNSSGPISIGDKIGNTTPLASLSIGGGGTTTINGSWWMTNGTAAVTTTGSQTYSGNIILGAPTLLKSTGGGQIFWSRSMDGAYPLTLESTDSVFVGSVGETTPLASLTSTAGYATIVSGTIKTTGSQTYRGTSPNNLSGRVFVRTPTTSLTSTSGSIEFGNVVDADLSNGNYGLDLNAAGSTTFSNGVGAFKPLAYLTVNGGSLVLKGGDITTTGPQTYRGEFVLANTSPAFPTSVLTSTGGQDIRFDGPINQAADSLSNQRSLAVRTTGTTTFNGTVGDPNSISSLTTDAGGKTVINTPVIRTRDGQTYNDEVILGASTTLENGLGGRILFQNTVDGPWALTVKAGSTTFSAAVGSISPLSSFSTEFGGVTVLAGGAVTTTGSQSHTNTFTSLAKATTLTSTGGGGIRLGAVRGPFPFVVNTSGPVTMDGILGGPLELESVWMRGGGSVTMNAESVNTTGFQTYEGNVTLGRSTSLISRLGGDISLGGKVDGPYGFSISTENGNVNFSSAIGSAAPLYWLVANGIRITLPESVTTTGWQGFQGNITMGGVYKADDRFWYTGP